MRVGVLSTLIGPYAVPGQDAVRGAELALHTFEGQAGSQPVEFIVEATNAMPSSATDAVTRLYRDGVRVFLGPLSGDEGIAVRDFANLHPDAVFVNGAAGSQPMFNPAENFFSFTPTGAQMVAGLGRYAHEELEYKKVATIGESYSFAFAHIGGFAQDYVTAGGTISKYLWCALGTKDYRSLIEEIPDDVNAVFSSLGGADGVHFIEQFRETGRTVPLIAGSIFGDQSLLKEIPQHSELLRGVVSASVVSDNIDTPEAKEFVNEYRHTFGDEGYFTPSLFAYTYYVNTTALLLALDAVAGDIKQLPEALTNLRFQAPYGEVYLDHHRVGVTDIFINQIRQKKTGQLYMHMLKRVPAATSTLGLADDEFMRVGRFGIDNMPGMERKPDTFEEILQRARQKKDKEE